MGGRSVRARIHTLLRQHGTTYAAEAGVRLKNTPAPLFQLLVLALLLSARLPAENAVRAARALADAGYITPRKMAQATWQQRVDVITWHGYKRYDERTSTMLGRTAVMVIDRYGGDLRRLRQAARGDIAELRRRLQTFKGIGPVGADIFLREVQAVWPELYPYVDSRVRRTGSRLHLGDSAGELAALVSRRDFPRLAAGLVRVSLDRRTRRTTPPGR